MSIKLFTTVAFNLIGCILYIMPVAAQKQSVSGKGSPNILLILSDDHSAPYLGCYGNSDLKTPNIDQLASEGMRFNNCYTAAPQCAQSRASIMTGRNVVDIEMLNFSAALDRNTITYPELLKKEGYYIGLCGRPYHLDGSNQAPETAAVFQKYKLKTFRERFDFVKEGSDEQTITQFEEFLNKPRGEKPFFMQACFLDPHRPFTAPEFEPNPNTLKLPPGMPDTELLRKDLAAHYGEIQRLDLSIGKLIAVLRNKGILDNTLIIFMGDNGSALLRGKGTLYDQGIHVPFLVRYPKLIKSGSISNILISGEDIGPTILDFAKVKPDDKMTGKSFLSAFKGIENEVRDYAFAVRGTHGSELPGHSVAFDLSRTIFNKKYKLIYNPLYNLPYAPADFSGSKFWLDLVDDYKAGKLPELYSQLYIFSAERPLFELYNLENDPNELVNLSKKPEYEQTEHQLKSLLLEWMVVNRDVVPLPIPPKHLAKKKS
jgi:N-sulfoglucosamine sulfohydrolase